MKQKIKLPAYRKAWEYRLSIEGLYKETCNVEIIAMNEFRQEVFYHSAEGMQGEEARKLLIEFCKKYRVSRDDMFFLHSVTIWMEGTNNGIYIANKDVLCI